MDRFEVCLPFTLAQECPYPSDWSNPANFSNDKHDPGGKTMCGIIQREYDIYRKACILRTQDVRQITQAEGENIYRQNYWFQDCPKLKPGLDLQFFDTSVNMGTTEATKILQVVIGVDSDGMWGPKTQAAVDAITDVGIIINALTRRRKDVYGMMKGFQYFGDDWIRRSTEIGAEALKMTGTT